MRSKDISRSTLREYQAQYPTSAILLVRSRIADIPLPQVARRDVEPAVSALRDILSENGGDVHPVQPELLVHLFSNGGSCMLYYQYELYAEKVLSGRRRNTDADADNDNHLLPKHVTVIDSAPSIAFEYENTVHSVVSGIHAKWMRWLLLPVVHLVGVVWWVRIRLLGIPDELMVWSQAHNDSRKVRETRRVYMYSDYDKSIPMHGLEAACAGSRVERLCCAPRALCW